MVLFLCSGPESAYFNFKKDKKISFILKFMVLLLPPLITGFLKVALHNYSTGPSVVSVLKQDTNLCLSQFRNNLAFQGGHPQ